MKILLTEDEREMALTALLWESQTRAMLSPEERAARQDLIERLSRTVFDADRRAGDFADDACGDPSLCPVQGMAC